jgi:hypothetical protein
MDPPPLVVGFRTHSAFFGVFFKMPAEHLVGETRKFMLGPQGRPIFLASPKIEGLICLCLEMLKCGTLL